jgi:uncharacterized protein (UPF0335 family)
MQHEAVLTFIYKTILAYSQYQEYIEQKLQGKMVKDKVIEGYLISKAYFNYWKKYSDYEDLKNLVQCNSYQNIRPTLYKYRKSNKYQSYQEDAQQIIFKSPEELYRAVKKENKSYILIDSKFWRLICADKGLKERGGVRFSLNKNTITFYFNEFDYCQIITKDNIIDSSKEMKSTGFDVVRQSDKEEKELEKLLLLYAYEQEMKDKINNLTYKENEFNIYYLISKEWISQYKKYYHYNEICNMIQKKDELKMLLNRGLEEAKKNIYQALKHISFKDKSIKKDFPEELKNNNTFLCEREDALISKKFNVSYWKNFELVNEEIKNMFMHSEAHGYDFDSVSDAICLITCGKVIINVSKDDYNENAYACEIGTICNSNMLFNEEYIFRYDNEEVMSENLSFATQDFLEFQKNYLNMDSDFECELLSKEGSTCGIGYKIPPHDDLVQINNK